jgi:hypothetical protein
MTAFVLVGVGLVCATAKQLMINKQEPKDNSDKLMNELSEVRAELTTLKRVNPLRKEAANLASDLHDFVVDKRELAMQGIDKFGKSPLTKEQEERVFNIYRNGVVQYYDRYDLRIRTLLSEIKTVTGKETAPVQAAALNINGVALETIVEVSNRIGDLAAGLP